MNAFSPRIHHAVSFAAKHHSGQRRKGRNTPYFTHPVNVALILSRYGRPEDEIIAGLLHDVIEDCVTAVDTIQGLRAKIGRKFGGDVLGIVDYVTEDKLDDNGVKLPVAERRRRYLDRMFDAPVGAHWVCAADKIHNGSSVIIDLLHAKDREAVWQNFSGGRDAVTAWYRSVHTRLREAGFGGAIMAELNQVASYIESAAIGPTA